MKSFAILMMVLDVLLAYAVVETATARKRPEKFNKDLQCKDENDNSVPWFIAYKLPKLKDSLKPTFKNGTGYSYLLPGSTSWQESQKGIDDSDSLIGASLRPFFQDLKTPKDKLLSVIYNDQPAYRDDFSYNGHAKGVILGNKSNGIWLMHSVPKFPSVPPPSTNSSSSSSWYYNFYPSNGLNNAQMFLCLSLKSAQIDSLGGIFNVIRPHINNSTLPGSLNSTYRSLNSFLNTKVFSRNGSTNSIFNLTTTDKLKFQVFAKSPKFNQEIYSEWLAPIMNSSLDVQSWTNGINAFTSNCSNSYPVYNIQDKSVGGLGFGRNDHSKWAIGADKKHPWNEGQKSRGGSTICLLNSKLWKSFTTAVIELQPCPLKRGR